jgi:hypothetical protein
MRGGFGCSAPLWGIRTTEEDRIAVVEGRLKARTHLPRLSMFPTLDFGCRLCPSRKGSFFTTPPPSSAPLERPVRQALSVKLRHMAEDMAREQRAEAETRARACVSPLALACLEAFPRSRSCGAATLW